MQYMGSKSKFVKELTPIIQNYITDNTKGYLEPFVGGANVIDKINCNNKIGCDIHTELIELLKYVQNNYNKLPLTISEEEYNNVKNNKDNYPKWYVGLVGFCASFGSKYFGGYARALGKNNKPLDRPAGAINTLRKQGPNLKDIKFVNCSFLDLPIDKIKGYVVYCDPPYRDTTKYSTKNFPYELFYDWCRKLSKNNVILVSEYNMPDDFLCIWEKSAKINIGPKNSKKPIRIEKLYIKL